jgi:hypothetical protein
MEEVDVHEIQLVGGSYISTPSQKKHLVASSQIYDIILGCASLKRQHHQR